MIKSDLHFHSTYSDGKLSVPELAEIIKSQELKFCSLVDHNSTAGIRELEEHLKGTGIKVIPGMELTAKYNEDEVHILTYDFDIDKATEIVAERNELVQNQKVEEMKEAIELSQMAGFEVTKGLVPNERQPVTLTTALDICAKDSNQAIFMEKHGRKFIPEDFYFEYQAAGKSCAVERSGVTVEWIIDRLKGIAKDFIIAHSFVSVSVVTKPLDEQRINDLLNKGITGLEVYHNETSDEQISLLKRIVRDRKLNFTGGSDFHGNGKDTKIGQYGNDRLIPGFRLTNYQLNQSEE